MYMRVSISYLFVIGTMTTFLSEGASYDIPESFKGSLKRTQEMEVARNTFRVIGFVASCISIPIWTKRPTPYKEYLWGPTCGVVWYSKTKSDKHKNLKIGFFALKWMPLVDIANIVFFDKVRFFNILIPNILLLNIKYKSLEMSFLRISLVFFGIIYPAIMFFVGGCNANSFKMILYGILQTIIDINLNIDVSYFSRGQGK